MTSKVGRSRVGARRSGRIITANLDIARALVSALVEVGILSGEQVDEIISATIAARAIMAERVRRADWRQRERNAATLLKELA
jgi:hypothetical protein